MLHIEKSIEVEVPLRTAYNQATQFEDFPRFMDEIQFAEQAGDARVHWKGEAGGRPIEGTAWIHDQVPDRRIVWRSIDGPEHSGKISFEAAGPERTRVSVQLTCEPCAPAGGPADPLVAAVEANLGHFKRYIEARGLETGSWRGEIHEARVSPPESESLPPEPVG